MGNINFIQQQAGATKNLHKAYVNICVYGGRIGVTPLLLSLPPLLSKWPCKYQQSSEMP